MVDDVHAILTPPPPADCDCFIIIILARLAAAAQWIEKESLSQRRFPEQPPNASCDWERADSQPIQIHRLLV